MKKTMIAVLAGAWLTAAPALAGDAPPLPPDAQATDIVVLGKSLAPPPGSAAYGTIVIDHKRLVDNASSRLEDVLRDVADLRQFRRADSRSANPSAQGVTLRSLGGNASSRALVLLDGVPQANPFFGSIPFNALVPGRLGEVRVTRGGGAGAFGAGAVAGTIDLSSATRGELPILETSAFFGSRNAQEVTAAFSPTLGSGFVSASGRFERGDGFFTSPVNQRGPADVRARYRDWSASLRGVVTVAADTELQARLLVFRDNRTLRFRGADNNSVGQDASMRIVHTGPWAFDALGYIQVRNFTNRVISSTSFRLALDQRNTPSTGLGGKFELRPPVGPAHLLRIGYDVRHAEGSLAENAYSTLTGRITATRNAGGHTKTMGVFVEDDWTLGRMILTVGGRVDRWTITNGFFQEQTPAGVRTSNDRFPNRAGLAPTGRIGALYNIGSVALRAAGYTGFRLPTLNELYRPFVIFPVVTQANAALALERSKGVEAGIDVTPVQGLALGTTVFTNRLGDAIANVTLAPTLRQRRNVDPIVSSGIELSARLSRGKLSFDGSYAFDAAHVRATGAAVMLDGRAPAQSPRHSASATLAWQPVSRAFLSATLRYVGHQFDDDLESDVLPPATTIDLVAVLPLTRRISFITRAENIANATVVTRNAAGSIDLGTPQTFWLGLRVF